MRRESRRELVATYMKAYEITNPRQSIIFDSSASDISPIGGVEPVASSSLTDNRSFSPISVIEP